MPAIIAHNLFAQKVFHKLEQTGYSIENKEIAFIGAQGPDIFFYHRILPWQPGESHVLIGRLLHRISPAKTFDSFTRFIRKEARYQQDMIDYFCGFISHYALDRVTHPYINWAADEYQKEFPDFGKEHSQYHSHIESALDTIVLRRETGRSIKNFNLKNAIPTGKESNCFIIGKLYKPVIYNLFGLYATVDNLSHAPKDMRHVMGFINDRRSIKSKVIGSGEKLFGSGAIATSFLRPRKTDDWDYANMSNQLWSNGYNNFYTSKDSFFDLFDFAISEAVDMALQFIDSLEHPKPMVEITQDRGFSSDLPGIYDGAESLLK